MATYCRALCVTILVLLAAPSARGEDGADEAKAIAVLLGTVFYGVTAALENFALRHRSGS